MCDPTIAPPARQVWHGSGCDCVDFTLYPVDPLPAEGPLSHCAFMCRGGLAVGAFLQLSFEFSPVFPQPFEVCTEE